MTLLDDRPLAQSVPSLGSGSGTLALVGEPATRGPRPKRLRPGVFSEAGLVVLAAFGTYFTVAMLLDFKYHSFDGDSISRMANGFYMLHSRDPHLAAIGFVWNPLSSIADLPLLTFSGVWPALASHNVAGTTMSALAMAGAVHQLHSILREWKVTSPLRLILTACFALNPMILLFGGDGMSEALYLFTMLAATRYLLRWLREDDLASLVFAAIALAFAYLERSEPVAAAALSVPLVCWVTYARSSGERRERVWAGLTDVVIFLMPIVTAFVGWAAVAWVITGQPFQQFTSKYGNAALIANSHIPIGTLSTRVLHEATAITYTGPLFTVIVVAALVVAARRRNVEILGVVSILGAGLGFTLASYLTNAIFPWYRYYILVAPLEVLLVGTLFAMPSTRRAPEGPVHQVAPVRVESPKRRRRTAAGLGALGASVVAIALLTPSIPGTAMAMDNPKIAPDVLEYTGFIFHRHLDAQDKASKNAYAAVTSMATYFDTHRFSLGDVIVDTADNCIPNVVTNVTNPRMFVIHNDRDFQRTLDDPLVFGAHYLLVQGAHGVSTDAVGQQYPSLGAGTNWTKLVHTFSAEGLCVGFTLYRVTGHPTSTF
jgi:hypothetical protein